MPIRRVYKSNYRLRALENKQHLRTIQKGSKRPRSITKFLPAIKGNSMTNYEVRQLGNEYLRLSISKAAMYSNFTRTYNKDLLNESNSPKGTGVRDIELEN